MHTISFFTNKSTHEAPYIVALFLYIIYLYKKYTMAKKKVITLTESQLNRIVAESTKQVLAESGWFAPLMGIFKKIGRAGLEASGLSDRLNKWEKRNPNITKAMSEILGLTPEEGKTSDRLAKLTKKIKQYITNNYGERLVQSYIQFANMMTKMVGARNIQDDEDFATYDDNTKYGVSPAFYNNCVNSVNMVYTFLKKWMVRIPDNITEITRINANSTFVTPQEKADVAQNCAKEWAISLNYGFYVFSETCNECYNGIKEEFGNTANIDRKSLVSEISEFMYDLKDIKQAMCRIDTYWFNGAYTSSNGYNGNSRQ